MKNQIIILSLLMAACGPPAKHTGLGPKNKEGVPEPPHVDENKGKTPDKKEFTADARKDFEAAATFFDQNDKAGWNDSACKQSAEKFEAVVREHAMVEAEYMVGRSYHACNMLDQAEDAYQAALKIDPNHAMSISNLGEIYWQQGKKDSAKKYWETAVKADPKIVAARANLAMLDIETLRVTKYGDTWKDIEKEARDHLSSVLAVDNDNLKAYVLYGMLYMEGREKNKNRLDLAKLLLDEGQKRADAAKIKYAPLEHAYGLYYLYKNDLTDALAHFTNATDLDDKFAEAHQNVALITLGYRKYDVAKDHFQKVLDLQGGKNYDALIGLAVAERGLNDLQGSEDTYNKAIKLDSTRGEAYFNLGVLYKDFLAAKENDLSKSQDRYKTARDYFKQFLDKKGNNDDDEQEAKDNIEDCDKVVKQLADFIKMQKENPMPDDSGTGTDAGSGAGSGSAAGSGSGSGSGSGTASGSGK
jgi:tetratricopeptide (TPR) repeat protein